MCDENKQLQDEELVDVSGGAGQIDIKLLQSNGALDGDGAKAATNSAEKASSILYMPPFI